MDRALAIEDAFDRERTDVPNSPRTLDVDLVVVGDRRSDTDALRLPHPRAAQRAFVLAALVRPRARRRAARPRPDRRAARRRRRPGHPAARRPRPHPGVTPARRAAARRSVRGRRTSRPASCGPTSARGPGGPRTRSAWSAAGWCVRWPSASSARAPLVTWGQPVALFSVAAVLGVTAWSTWRAVHVRHERLLPHQAVNRLVLARACALVGALVGRGLRRVRRDLARAGGRARRPACVALGGGRAGGAPDLRHGTAPRACVSRPSRRPGALVCSAWLPHPSHRHHDAVSAAPG